mgnify:CR=1 FL=1
MLPLVVKEIILEHIEKLVTKKKLRKLLYITKDSERILEFSGITGLL